MSKGKRIAPQIQRTRSDDLLASVFPQAAACFETIVGDIQIPDHPLVNEVMKDVLHEAMDLEGLIEVLAASTTEPSAASPSTRPSPPQFAHELLNANPYAFLDDAGLEERRARAVTLRRDLPDSVPEGAGRLDQAAIDTVRRELWPDLRDEHELHDLLHSASSPCPSASSNDERNAPLAALLRAPRATGRRHHLRVRRNAHAGSPLERLPHATILGRHANASSSDAHASYLIREQKIQLAHDAAD